MSEVAVQFKNILWDTFPGTHCMYLYRFVNRATIYKVCSCIVCGWGHCKPTAWIELRRQSIGAHSATIRLPSSCSSTTMLQTHHHLQYNKIYLVWNLDCDLWCFLILRSADLGQTVHAAGANVQWLCNLLMVPPNIVFLVFLYCIVVLLMVPPNMDPHTKLPLLLGSSD